MNVRTNKNEEHKLNDVNIGKTTLKGNFNSKEIEINLDEVTFLEYESANRGLAGGIIGSIVGTGIGVLVALQTIETKQEGYIETTEIQVWPIYVFCFGGGLIGWEIGKNIKTYSLLYDEYANKFSLYPDLYFTVMNKPEYKQIFLGINYRF